MNNNYILTPDGELMHYGVKGMKWGVRRAIGVKARAAALNKQFADGAIKNVKRLEARKAKKGLTDREAKKLKDNKKLAQDFTAKRNALIKDMSPNDIKRGERAVNSRVLLGATKGFLDLADLSKANKQLERERNRNR